MYDFSKFKKNVILWPERVEQLQNLLKQYPAGDDHQFIQDILDNGVQDNTQLNPSQQCMNDVMEACK